MIAEKAAGAVYSALESRAIEDRRLPKAAVEKYRIKVALDENGQPFEHHYPLLARGDAQQSLGKIVRALPKTYRADLTGSLAKAELFGSFLFPKGCAKTITITEGHLDAVAAYVMHGSRWPCVSINGGAGNALKEIKANLEYLESFEKVYFCFDMDEQGRNAALECAKVVSPGKAFIVKMDPELKDPCNYLKTGQSEQFIRAWWDAPLFTPAGILTGQQVKDRIRNRPKRAGIPYPYPGLNDLTYGIRKGEAVIVTAPTGVGKTSFLRETQEAILQHDPTAKIGTMYLEETPEDSGLGLMSIRSSIPFHLPDAEYTKEQWEEAQKVLDEDRVFFYDSFGSTNLDDIVSRVRYYVRGLGCSYVFLDHLSIIVSDQSQGDERKALDSIMTRLKTLTIELDMALIAVVHTNRAGQIRGTAGIEQLANIVIQLDRDTMAANKDERLTQKVMVAKNRFSGRTGPACLVKYDEVTGRSAEKTFDGEKVSEEELTKFFGNGTLESVESLVEVEAV